MEDTQFRIQKPKNFQGQKVSSDPDPLLLPFCQKASFEKFINHAYASYAIYMMRWLSSLISFLTNDDEKTFKVEETLKLLEIHRRIYSLYLSWENTKKDEGHSRILLFPSAFQKWLNHFQVHLQRLNIVDLMKFWKSG